MLPVLTAASRVQIAISCALCPLGLYSAITVRPVLRARSLGELPTQPRAVLRSDGLRKNRSLIGQCLSPHPGHQEWGKLRGPSLFTPSGPGKD